MATFITQEQRAKLIELYIGYFNRAPEAAGLNYWAGELLSALNAGQTEEQALKSIADRFYDAGVQYGIFSNGMTVEEFIRTVYQNVLGRDEVDAAGMTYWTQKLTSGEVSRGQFVRQVIQEAKDYVAAAPANDPYKWVGTYLENRKAVGEWFANNSAGLTGQDAIAKGTAIIENSVTKATAQAGQTAAEAIAAAQAAQQSQQGKTFTLTADAPSVIEGNSGTKTLTFTVNLDKAPTEAVVVNYQTVAGGTATAGDDYNATAGTITFAAGQTAATVSVTVNGDAAFEADETVNIKFSGAKLAADVTATGTITNDDRDTANDPQTFTLTAGADNIVGTAGNDTINALTIDATGAAAETFSSFDNIDGGAGTDTLNIYTTAMLNEGFPTSATVKNVEIINLFNSSTTANEQFGTTAAVDASKFTGATQIWQIGAANNNGIANVAATTTAGLRNLTADDTVNTSVAAATGATSVNVALDAVKGKVTTNVVTLGVSGDAVAAVNVSGTIAQQTVNATAASLALGVTAGKDVETLTLNSAVKTTVSITEGAGSTKEIKTVDASASTGGITYAGTVTGGTVAPATIKTGSGADDVTITVVTAKDNTATASVDETVSALVQTGAGNDKITINTSGDGTTTVEAGDGDDEVTFTTAGSGKLTVNLGAGNDTFKGAGAVKATDLVDGGDGTDTLLLSMVGAANIGAFSNFETFDAVGMNKTLDVEILAAKNTVTEFVMSGDNGGAAALTNIGAGVGFRVTGDTTVNNVTTLTQKTAGALTITLDIDETGTTAATTASTDRDAAVVASNATSVKAVFDSAFVGAATGAGDNATSLTITGTKATSLEVVSGGSNASNTLLYTGGNDATAGKGDLLTSVTISGDRAVNFDYAAADATEITSINASALTGALTFNLDDLKAAGTLTLGSGDDVITVQAGVGVDVATIIAAHRKISGVEKGSAEDLTAISNYDVFKLAGAIQAVDATGTDASVKDGLISFKGTGPATLDQAVTFAQALIGANEAAVFEYVGKSYIFAEGATDGAGDDVLIELTGVTGLNGLDVVNATAGTLYVF